MLNLMMITDLLYLIEKKRPFFTYFCFLPVSFLINDDLHHRKFGDVNLLNLIMNNKFSQIRKLLPG